MTLAPYRRVLAVRGVRSVTLLGILARIPATAIAMVLTLHVVLTMHRGYGEAGLVVASFTLGAALGAPWRGRAVDRLGLRRALIPSIVVEAAVWGASPWMSFDVLIGMVFLAGLLGIPVFTVIRLSLSILVPEEQRRAAFALDSMAVEGSFMAGPALGVLVATHFSTVVALLVLGATAVLAGIALMVTNPPTRRLLPATETSGPGPAARGSWRPSTPRVRVPVSGSLLAVLGAAAGGTVVLTGTDVAIVAVLRGHQALQLTGVVMVAWGIASLVGGLVYGAAPKALPPLVLLLCLGALTVPIGLAPGPWALCLAILPAGALCAPVVSSTAEAIARLVPESARGEAMGWHGSALTAGSAAGAPIAGLAIDHVAPWAGFTVVGAAGLVLALLGLTALRVRRGRSRSGDDAGEPLAGSLAGSVRQG